MIAAPARPKTLTEQQWTFLGLVERYRTLTPDLLLQLCPDQSRDALRMSAERLRKDAWLTKSQLARGETCYALGPRAWRLLGMHHHPGFPFTGDGILQHLGIALFCVLAHFRRLLPHEFHARFPDCHRTGLPAQNYCLDKTDNETVCWAIVDHASEAKRFPGKVLQVISARLGLAGFEELCASEKFRIVIITAAPEKKSRIQTALEERGQESVPVSIVSIPSLLQFLL